ncbi:MAG: glycosyltransferase family 2 protein [Bacteroidetes bacterium]|nr:glycosyltransferase family 2 protein [Bacteroidota bacterium]
MSQIEKALIPISIIICTYNRASYLKLTLKSLTAQTLDKQDYEIVVIDDGSSDNTREIVGEFSNRLPIKYFYQENAGLASSKNHGIYAAQGRILLFLDDDDIATPTLLEEHLKTHYQYPDDFYAVLNYTTWSPNLNVTPLMHFITEVGCFLFSYPYIKHGNILDYTNFWGGRSSCKRSFLINHGVFNQIFRFGCEDIELGYRLSKHDLKVVYNAKAISMMIRPITFDDFCKRLIKQGRSQYVFSQLSNDPEVDRYTEVPEIEEKWLEMETLYEARIHSARELDKIVNLRITYGFEIDDLTKRLLHKAYWWAFRACKIKGMIEG